MYSLLTAELMIAMARKQLGSPQSSQRLTTPGPQAPGADELQRLRAQPLVTTSRLSPCPMTPLPILAAGRLSHLPHLSIKDFPQVELLTLKAILSMKLLK
jgi:hypothetical protein